MLLEQPVTALPGAAPRPLEIDVDERAARRSLREQVAKLERELADVLASAYPRHTVDVRVRSWGGPRLLSLGELEGMRDELSHRLRDARSRLSATAAAEEEQRLLVERMMLDPKAHKFARVTREQIGERGCGGWEVRPRLGLIGMLMGWWQVKLSSGCPLPGGRGAGAAARRRWDGAAASARRRPRRRGVRVRPRESSLRALRRHAVMAGSRPPRPGAASRWPSCVS